ncbi:MAG: ribonuclease HI [Treponema sp.]|jgi:ribonuclease HI|nr:ribonuclease HI [Treponema sp.]
MEKENPGLRIYTDGGCSGNPGPGGWAYVILAGDSASPPALIAEKWGAQAGATNNRMELTAVISALEALPALGMEDPGRITVYTDSQYVQKGISQWIHTWKRNNWRTSGKAPVKNQDLWQRLDRLTGRYSLTWAWVRGHAGNEMNERCDRMTQEAIRSLR